MLDRRRAAVLTAVLAALVYANALGNGFAYDDVPIVEEHTAIQSLETLPGAIVSSYWPGTRGEAASLWRPVTTAAFGLQYWLGGGSPVLFHAVNIVLHAVASVGVLLFLAYLMPLAGALTAAIVFALHPVHVEAVANVVGFSELFSTAALLAALIVHVRAPARIGWAAALAVGGLYAAAFGAKESAVVLPGLVFLVDAARRRLAVGDLRAYLADRWRVYLVLLVVAVAMLAARAAVLGRVASPTGPMGADLLHEVPRIWTLAEVWTHYVRLWVFPLDLAADYAPNVIPISLGWHATNVVGAVLALAILTVALVAWRKPELRAGRESARIAGFGIVWFLIAISPVSNALFLSGVTLAERTLYLPSVGLAAVTGWLLVLLLRERKALGRVVVALVVALSVARTWTRTPTWNDTPSVFLTMLREQPHSGRAQWMLGDNFWIQGDTTQALATYRHAVNLLDGHYRLLVEVGRKLMQRERYPSAERLIRSAWREHPDRPRAPRLLTSLRAELGDVEGTERFARRALSIHPEDPVREHLLAWALAAQGSWDEAVEARRRGEALGAVDFWQPWLYEAYVRRRAGDVPGMRSALDSARHKVRTNVGRTALDSILRHDFAVAEGESERGPGG